MKFIGTGVIHTSLDARTYRGADWASFATDVLNHIENYTVKQYGDRPDDQASNWSIEFIEEQLKKYTNRFGKNARSGEELRDLLKIAHYAQILYYKRREAQFEKNSSPANSDSGTPGQP
jgi:hypothetical protein